MDKPDAAWCMSMLIYMYDVMMYEYEARCYFVINVCMLVKCSAAPNFVFSIPDTFDHYVGEWIHHEGVWSKMSPA